MKINNASSKTHEKNNSEIGKRGDELDEREKQAVLLYAHLKELAIFKYEAELQREDSLVRQSGQMQTVFAFMSAAIFMATPVLLEYRGILTLDFFLLSVSSVMLFLLISLTLASLIQFRRKHKGLPNIEDIEKEVETNWEKVLNESQKLKQYVILLGEIQKSKTETNDKRVLFIKASMGSFMCSITLIIFWYVVAIIKII